MDSTDWYRYWLTHDRYGMWNDWTHLHTGQSLRPAWTRQTGLPAYCGCCGCVKRYCNCRCCCQR